MEDETIQQLQPDIEEGHFDCQLLEEIVRNLCRGEPCFTMTTIPPEQGVVTFFLALSIQASM